MTAYRNESPIADPHFLPIADNWGDIPIFMSLEQSGRSPIYISYEYPPREGRKFEPFLIADSFKDFLDGLTRYPEPPQFREGL